MKSTINATGTNPTGRFSDRVGDYVKYRPQYPIEVITFFKTKLGLGKSAVIVDIGSGTGISSELFLKNGNVVYGVEPNEKMRLAAEDLLSRYPNFKSTNGKAEETGLPSQTADYVIAAQAFHWFDKKNAKNEFKRILKPNGYAVLIWNDRNTTGTPFAIEYEALINEFSIDYGQVKHKNLIDEDIQSFLGVKNYGTAAFPNFQEFDLESLKGRLTSSSYAPNKDHPNYTSMCSALKKLFDKHEENGIVRIEYDTKLYFAQMSDQ